MRDNLRNFADSPASYRPFVEQSPGEGKQLLDALANRACIIVTDDFPAFEIPRWISSLAGRTPVSLEKVDSNGILPMHGTDRIFRTAASFRGYFKKQQSQVFPVEDPLHGVELPRLQKPPKIDPNLALPNIIDQKVGPVFAMKGGWSEAQRCLQSFIRSDKQESGLSPYLHFGHISSHEVYHAVVTSKRRDAERFLDQLTTWRELGINLCAHSSDYDKYSSLPTWAQNTLAKHARDPRPVVYTLEQLENADTHDSVWNSAQQQLVTDGRIHNYLRMLWGKKILEWSPAPEEALSIMIHLNNKYALDGRDPNSYSGIFWTLGRYDRPWGPERPIFGLVRYMSSSNTAKKLRRASQPPKK
jgi:deoxyribodipyrimidine photo-lyase